VRLDQARGAKQKVPCYVSARDPSDSVWMRDLRVPKLIEDALGALVMITLGVRLVRIARNAPLRLA
jgi:hypothetical protein